MSQNLNIILISNDSDVINKAKAITKPNESCHYTLSVINDLAKFNPQTKADILLVDQPDKSLFEQLKTCKVPQPIIYLSTSFNTLDTVAMKQIGMYEVLDMSKATANGLNRTINHLVEQSQFIKQLIKQQQDLKQLLTLQEDKPTAKSNYQDQPITNEMTALLINENKKLIEKVRAQNKELQNISRHDPLTGIPNRRQFEETLEQQMAHSKRHKTILALLLIDLDRFKNVNDNLGHQIGDEVLKQVAERMKGTLRKSDYVARIGGDEFTVILTDLKTTHAAGIVAWKIITEVSKPYTVDDRTINIGASIGIGCYPLIGESPEDLIRSADIAMYEAKKSQTEKYHFANMDIQTEHLRLLQIEDNLRYAIETGEFHLVYQPIFHLPDLRLHGFEILLRWNNKNLGTIPPDQFIPIAEDSGLILAIGDWIIDTACKEIKSFNLPPDSHYKFCINLSPKQLQHEVLLKTITEVVKKYDLPYAQLEFELTEMAIMAEKGKSEKMINELYLLGTTHALDDFGTGYSSLSHLKYLPINTLKIDLTFVQGIGVNEGDETIVKAIIALAKKLNLGVIAEGVETKEHLDFLIENNCQCAQGYYFSKPVPKDEILKILKKDLELN